MGIPQQFELTHDVVTRLLRYDPITGDLTWLRRGPEFPGGKSWNGKNAGKIAGCVGVDGYKLVGVLGRKYYVHQIVWLIHYGQLPHEVDHINHDRNDNRISNLRLVDRSVNMKNTTMRRDNTSGFTGVRWAQTLGKWRASINVDKQTIYLGVYENLDDAIAARAAANAKYGFHANHGVRSCN